MDRLEILKHVDHTLLAQGAAWEDIRQILDDAVAYGTASACIPAAYVRRAADYVDGRRRQRYMRPGMLSPMERRRLTW